MKVDSETLRIYKAVHTWTGLLAGLALFIAFYAGALTLFKSELDAWVRPAAPTPATALAEAGPLVEQLLREQAGAARELQLLLREQGRSVVPRWQAAPAEDGDEEDDEARTARQHTAWRDATGRLLIGTLAATAPLGRFIDELHRVVGLPVDNDACRWVMGVIAGLYALALFSGLVLALPTLVKDFFALRLGRNLKRFWLDAHNAVGIASLPFHLVIALTAVVFAFHDGLYGLQDRLLHQGQLQRRTPPALAAPQDPGRLLSPAQLLTRVAQEAPSLQVDQLQYLQVLGARPQLRVWGRDAAAVSPRARGGFIALDPYSGRVLNRDFLPGQQGTAALIISSAFALHMASFGGSEVRWLYFLLALAGAWLFYSGNLLWIESRRKRARGAELPQQTRAARTMAALTLGVSLGCVTALSLLILACRLLPTAWFDALPACRALYYTVWFACIALACWRGPARAAVPLLALAASSTLALALLALVDAGDGNGNANGHGAAALLALVAGLGGVGLLAMARATARRIRDRSEPSVWALPARE